MRSRIKPNGNISATHECSVICGPIGCAVDFVCRLLHLKIISLKNPLQIGLCNKATEVDKLVKRGIAIQFVKENITFTAQSTPMDNLILQLMGAFAQFEREIILERQKEGIKLASSQGKYKGRVHKLKPDQAEALRQDWKEGKYPSKMALGQAFGISRQAVYRYLKAGK